MRPDLVVEARAYVRGSFQDVEFGIDAQTGRILAVKKTLEGSPRLRFRGKLVAPSGIDLHVHFRDPGAPKKEDFRTGTMGAALGGIGTVLDMPNTDPVVDRVSRLEEKRSLVAPKACVDWGLWSTITAATSNPIELAQRSAAVKLFLAPTTGIPDPGSADEIGLRIASAFAAGRLVGLHAEMAPHAATTSLLDHDAKRPAAGEVAAIEVAASLAPDVAALHVCHATTQAAVDAARNAGCSVGATPHHLILANDERDLGAWGKVNPPLRKRADRDALWAAFARGDVPILESDHAPHTREEKSRAFEEAPSGVPGVETMLPLLLHEASRRGVDPARVVQAVCEAPASLLGLPKGRIEAGHDADFFVFDPKRTRNLRGVDLASPCAWTPYEGRAAVVIDAHFVRGQAVVEDGRFVGRPGTGRMVRPSEAKPRSAPTSEASRPRGAPPLG